MEKPLISGFVEKQREDKTWAWRGKATEPTIGQPGLRLMKNSYMLYGSLNYGEMFHRSRFSYSTSMVMASYELQIEVQS
jgi:hypothetical protein